MGQVIEVETNSYRWAWFLPLLPFMALVAMFLLFSHNIPYLDQWEFIPFLQKFHDGGLNLGDFWAQHNEHRILFPRMIMLGFAVCTGWNIYYELAVNLLLGTGIFLLLIKPLLRTGAGAHWNIVLASLMLFSLGQWQNWFLGWQLQVFLSLFMVIVALRTLSRKKLNAARFSFAILAGSVAMFSFANGMLVWPLGLILLWRTENRTKWLALWSATAILLACAYFRGYQAPSYHPSFSTSLHMPGNLLAYVFIYLGQPVAGFSGFGAVAAGAFGMAAWGILSVMAVREKEADDLLEFSIPPMFFVALGLYAVASAIITAFARAGFGAEQALSSRYVTLASPLWISILALAGLRIQQNTSPTRKLLMTGFGVILALLVTCSSLYGAYRWTEHYHAHVMAREALMKGENSDVLHFLYPDIPKMLERREILVQHHLSIFQCRN